MQGDLVVTPFDVTYALFAAQSAYVIKFEQSV
jgi:hypothetical protein